MKASRSLVPGPGEHLGTALGGLLAALLGVVIGMQYVQPNLRVIAVMVAVVVFGIAWRIDMITGLGVLVLTLPFPKGTVFGNTNLALILLLLVIWLLRVTQRQSPGLTRTPVDVPIVGLLIAYILSFYNLERPEYLPFALQNTQLMVAGMLMFYLVASNVRTEAELRRFHAFQIVSIVTICALALYELSNPGAIVVPGWIEFPHSGEVFETRNVRVGGAFFDYELLAEYCAISLLLTILWLVRARSVGERTVLGAVFLVTVFTLFATVTRGAIVSLSVVLLYMTWIMRRRIRVVPFTILLCVVVGGFLAMNFYVAHFTRSGDMLGRLLGTEFQGLVPDSRRGAWTDGWERFLLHPILGHGPFYSSHTGTRTWFWPHNGYLYLANLTGIVGLTFFVGILIQLFRMSLPRTDSLTDPSYARSYLLVAHLQLILFIVDQVKIDFLRNAIYPFQVWLLFASIAAASGVAARATPGPSASG